MVGLPQLLRGRGAVVLVRICQVVVLRNWETAKARMMDPDVGCRAVNLQTFEHGLEIRSLAFAGKELHSPCHSIEMQIWKPSSFDLGAEFLELLRGLRHPTHPKDKAVELVDGKIGTFVDFQVAFLAEVSIYYMRRHCIERF